MITVLKYLKPFIWLVALAVCLLGFQAVAELTQPNLMSDIVNVGLQGGGITEEVPHTLTPQGMGLLLIFMTPEDAAVFREAYGAPPDYMKTESAPVLLQSDDPALAEIYGRAAYFFMQKGMAFARQMAEARGAQPEQGGQMSLEDISMEQLYGMGMMMAMDPGLQSEIRAAREAPMDSMIYGQVGKAMIKLFYEDAGLDTVQIQRQYIYKVGAKMILLAFGCGLSAVCVGLLSARIAAGLSRSLRRSVFTKVQSFSKAEIDKFSTASLITRSTNDVQQVQMMVLMGIRMLVFAPVMGVGGTVMALRKSVNLSWVIVLAILLMVCALIVVMIVVMPKFKKLQQLIDKLNLVSRENLTGLMVVRAFGNEKHEERRFDAAAYNLMRTERFINRSMALLMPMMMLLMNGMSMLVVWFGGKAIESSALQIGDMMAFIQYSMHIIMSFMFVAMIFVMVPRAAVAAGRIKEVLETEITVEDPIVPKELPDGPLEIVFDSVSFRYAGAEEDVLSDISFTAKPGQTTAFIGATGAGKTTLVNLIERFYDVTQGRITVGGADLRELPLPLLRAQIGFVPQKAVLFSGDIRGNVEYGDGESLTGEEVWEALRTAQAEDFTLAEEHGLAAYVAQEGANYSGGQKQRLSIARAAARKPRVYIFDDSFSALDFKTDAALRRALKARTEEEQATVFIVAQRVSTIMNAEQIVVLDEGKVAGIGTHKELLKSCGVYREIAESQLSWEELQ